MRDRLGRLENDQALLGTSEVDATSLDLSDHRVEIGPGVSTEERELEAAASDGCPVAGPGVAAEPGEDRDPICPEDK